MKKVIMRGGALTQSGYGEHARQLARALLDHPDVDVKFSLTPWGMTPWSIDREACGGLVGRIIERETTTPVGSDVSFQVMLPNEWNPELAKFNVGITAGVETDICNPEWINCVNRMNLVIVPSTFVLKTFLSSGSVTTPVKVVPEAFHPSCYDAPPSKLQLSTNFNFLIFGQMSGNPLADRKNTVNTIKWLCDVFADDKDVGIVLKTNLGRNSCLDRQETLKILKAALKLGRPGPYPRVHLLHGDMTEQEVCGIYHHPSVRVLVTATRGEGFGLPILEAAASGLPVLATNWSGHLDFMNLVKHVSFDFRLLPVDKAKIDSQIFVPGCKWADVDENDFKKKVARFRKTPHLPLEWARCDRSKILDAFNQNAISKIYHEIIDSIG